MPWLASSTYSFLRKRSKHLPCYGTLGHSSGGTDYATRGGTQLGRVGPYLISMDTGLFTDVRDCDGGRWTISIGKLQVPQMVARGRNAFANRSGVRRVQDFTETD